jgi:hypothetical protein
VSDFLFLKKGLKPKNICATIEMSSNDTPENGKKGEHYANRKSKF